MTPKEIQKNRTQGEWVLDSFKDVDGYPCVKITAGNQTIDFIVARLHSVERIFADNAAKVSAVNGTWNKGYNPAQMDRLYQTLSFCMSVIKAGGMFERSEQLAVKQAQQALITAKL